MGSITHRHEGTSEWTTLDAALDLNQSASSKELDGLWPNHISPSTLVRAFLQFGRERSSHRVNILPDRRNARFSRECVGQQIVHLRILPLFLSIGAHLATDVPEQVNEVRDHFRQLEVEVLARVGEDRRLGRLIQQIVIETLSH